MSQQLTMDCQMQFVIHPQTKQTPARSDERFSLIMAACLTDSQSDALSDCLTDSELEEDDGTSEQFEFPVSNYAPVTASCR